MAVALADQMGSPYSPSLPLQDTALVAAIDALIGTATTCGVETGTILLAVSGGPDSLALLLGAAAWVRAGKTSSRLAVATVDHRLRPESAGEAAFVARLCANLGLAHETLVWKAGERRGNLPAAAREARYRLLLGHARNCGAGLVLTAHHQDDQFETHCLAERRGAAPIDAAGMRALRYLDVDVLLGRPFLEITRTSLVEAVGRAGWRPVDDPSNRDPASQRVKIRQDLAAGRLDRKSVLEGLNHCRRQREAADAALARTVAELSAADALAFHTDGAIRLSSKAYGALNDDIARRLLSRLVVAVSGENAPPSGPAVQRMHHALRAASADGEVVIRTLAGALIMSTDAILFMREIGRRGIESLALEAAPRLVPGRWLAELGSACPGRSPASSPHWTLFDGRFAMEISAWRDVPGAAVMPLASLGKGNRRQLSQPVLVDGKRRPVAAAAAAAARIGPDLPRLECLSLSRFRLMRDLPETPSVQPISR